MDELLKQREIIEVSLRQSIRELSEMGVGPEDSLLDSEGFPRVDIDLYRVRSLRSSIARQQNDYKAVMKLIEEMLPKVLPSSASAEESISMGMKRSSLNDSLEPFAKIGVVPIDSLAFKGLCTNDLVLKFGSLTSETFTSLNDFVQQLSSHSEKLEIVIRRGHAIKTVKLESVTSSLGCQILCLKSEN